jgi:hypothetical protein
MKKRRTQRSWLFHAPMESEFRIGVTAVNRLCLGLLACAALAIASIAEPAVAAAAPAQFTLAITQTDTPPKLDGTLNDPLWTKSTHIQLTWDYQFRRPASEPTDVYVMADTSNLYVAFVAEQSEQITASQHTNDTPLTSDDAVRVYLWPAGENGFEYYFAVNPIGTRNAFSGENSAFAPRWSAVATHSTHGYIVTEQIPLHAMRGDGRATWRLQFDRSLHVTGQTFEWTHDPSQLSTDSVTYTGYLTGMNRAIASTRTKPRIGLYTLGQAGAMKAGGTRARMGADIALPITNTASFFSTLYPDYSNVDQDQQTIAPTAFQRQYTEVRPFFTQGGTFYNVFDCNDCYDVPLLYTPAIPTPREGYAVEGVQGPAHFAAFDALGVDGRSDNAQALTLTTADNGSKFNVLRFATVEPGVEDTTTLYQLSVGNVHNFTVFATAGGESGTEIAAPALGRYDEYGLNLFAAKSGLFYEYHDIGPRYAPPDGYTQISDIHGPTLTLTKEFDNAPTSYIQSYTLTDDIERFQNSAGVLNLADAQTGLMVTSKTQYSLQAIAGYQYLLLADGYGSMIDQTGVTLSHGSQTATPTSIAFNSGRFGHGYLHTTTRLTTVPVGSRGTFALEADNTDDATDAGTKDVQWLERGTFTYQFNSSSSFAIGLRRIIGTAPLLVPPAQFTDAANVSLAYHRRLGPNEIYVVYGDPNQVSTLPALIVKFVHYFGADKGT